MFKNVEDREFCKYTDLLSNEVPLLISSEKDDGDLVFEGIVTAISWDKDDIPTSYSLFQYNAEELLLQSPSKNFNFSLFANKRVQIKGRVVDEHNLICKEIKIIKSPTQSNRVKNSERRYFEEYKSLVPIQRLVG